MTTWPPLRDEDQTDLPRMLWEQCEGGCGDMGRTVYQHDYPSGARLWECRYCWTRNQLHVEGRYIERASS